MKDRETLIRLREDDSPILQKSVPAKMLIACFACCIFGVALMALLSEYLLMAAFLSIILCVCITTPLLAAGKISVHTACLIPMLLLCFVYTPISWFALDGLLGPTPYLSILFITVITLTHYRRIHQILFALYGVMMVGLILHWLLTWTGERDAERIITIMITYFLTVLLNTFFIENVKRKNLKLNKQITDLSLRDDLTGLMNRRAIEQVLHKLESDWKIEGGEYAIVMLDIDKLKDINDLFGHALGDSVLKTMASSILKNIRSEDFAFRFGGDEFLLLLPHVDKTAADDICGRIDAGLRDMQGYSFALSASKGCALRSEGACPEEALTLADRRMYENKRCRIAPEI